MNLSLRNRVAAMFVISNIVVLVLSFTVFHFLNSLNQDIDKIMDKSNQVSKFTDEVRVSTISILKYQRKLLTGKARPEIVDTLMQLCDEFLSKLSRLDSLYKEPNIKKVIGTMSGEVSSLKVVLSKATFYRNSAGLDSISELADNILQSLAKFQDLQKMQTEERDSKMSEIINETKRNMMITLIIGFMGTIILGLIVPGKIALPFKKINDAIRELQDCNFDVSIYYNQDDEIGEIAREMNKMIHNMKIFEELRSDRIGVELRKFDTLANLVKKPVMVANARNELMYMNNKLYEVLQVQSDDVLSKKMSDTVLPKSIIDAFELAIKRRSKIENSEIKIPNKHAGEETEEGEVIEENAFVGFANVIPIRGKDSSLDYYLMVMSKDVIA